MEFLAEKLTWNQASIITEGGGMNADGKPKELYMKGIFIQGGVRNHNQRVYPLNEIRRAVDQVNESISNGETIWGEADHPEGLTINLDRISHMITELRFNEGNGIGKLKIIDTPLGNVCRTLIECGGKLGVSSRGSGNVNESSGEVSDFEIITVDIVARPSAPQAYPSAVYERRLTDAFAGRRGSVVEDLAEAVKHDPKAQKYFREEILDWMNKSLRS